MGKNLQKIILSIALMLLFSVSVWGQVSPDYIFGDDNGAGWNWTTGTQGTASAGNSYLWQFAATAVGGHYVKFGESTSNADGSGFWVNSAGTDMNYTGAGAKWTAYYQANMGSGGAIYWTIVSGNYYVVKTKLNGANTDFAVFDNGAVAPVTISSVARVIAGTDLTVTATASAVASANEKVWVRYSLDNWTSSTTTELVNVPTTTTYAATLSLLDGDFISYYVYTTIQQVAAPAEADADFFTIAYNNNGGVNYTAQIGTLSGDYYIPQNGNAKGYNLLSTAVTNLNANGMSANVNFYITGNITEPANIGLGVNTGGFNLTIRPDADADRTITFTQLADNLSPTGHFVIGYTVLTSAWADANTIATSNVTIDGYAVGGSTRRLIFTNTAAAHAGARVIVVVGACENTIVKNCTINNLTTSTSSPFCIGAVVRKGTAIEVAPIGLTFENNVLTAIGNNVAMGVRLTNSGTLTTAKITGFVFKNNIVTAKRRLVEINYTDGAEIYGNQFTTVASTAAPATVSYGLWTATGVIGTINIYNNKFLQATCVETSGNGHRVASLASGPDYNIYNNMFAGMEKTSATTTTNMAYLFFGGTGAIYNNTFYMPALTNPSSTTGYYASIQLSTANPIIKNNIFINDEPTHVNTYFVSGVTTANTDYNDYFLSTPHAGGKIVSTYTTLADYQTANPTKDINSISKDVNFVDVATGDLHLTGTSLGDTDLIADLTAGVLTDIDGETRSLTFPYMGADENLANLLPVELTKFDATLVDDGVMLYWSTATEVNNYGFEVEVSTDGENWENVGFVEGHGNSNSQQDYNFLYTEPFNNKVNFRLKQVDTDGGFEYSEVVSVLSGEASFKLNQNYPNPFNPTTIISFSLKASAKVTLKVYNALGQEVAVLANNVMDAGFHEVDFDASNLASGVYIYRLDAPGYSKTMKMMLLK